MAKSGPLSGTVRQRIRAFGNVRKYLGTKITRPGLEPGKSEPKSDVLPLHHRVTYFAAKSMTCGLWEQDRSIESQDAERIRQLARILSLFFSVVAETDADFAKLETDFVE